MPRTLYLRDVPDEIIARLETLAARTGASVSATAVAELSAVTKRASNAEVLNALPDVGYPASQIVVDIEDARSGR